MEQDQRRRLINILSDEISEDELRAIAYCVSADDSGWFDNLRGDTQKVKAASLIQYSEYRNIVGEVVGCIQQFCPKVDISSFMIERSTSKAVEFVNRRDEIKQLTSDFALQYDVIDAPAGYGKTELLQKVIQYYRGKGWLSLYIAVPKDRPGSIEDIVTAMLGGSTPKASVCDTASEIQNGERLGAQIAQYLIEQLKEAQSIIEIRSKGIILIIDDLQSLKREHLQILLNDLIPSIQRVLSKLERDLTFRVVFVGRFIANSVLDISHYIKAKMILEPFNLRVVEETIKVFSDTYGAHLRTENISTMAAELMFVTGGHPGCMASILARDYPSWVSDRYFVETEDENYKSVVLPVIENIRTITVRELLDNLSPCRRYTSVFLRKFLELGIIQGKDEFAVEKELTATYLINRKQGFLQDDIVRRLLAIRFRKENPQGFQDIVRHACSMYEVLLGDVKTSRPEMIAIELLFQQLQLLYFFSAPTSRAKISEEFYRIANGKIQKLVLGRDKHDVIEDLRSALEDDWEFQYTLNYFLRSNAYDDKPYKKLLRLIHSSTANSR